MLANLIVCLVCLLLLLVILHQAWRSTPDIRSAPDDPGQGLKLTTRNAKPTKTSPVDSKDPRYDAFRSGSSGFRRPDR
jgi:hypothetical protein